MSTLYLFPPDQEQPEDSDLLAAEYALGVLDAGDAAATRLRAESDPALRHAVAVWQARLAALAEILPRETPPHQLWQRLAFDIGLPEPQPTPPPPTPARPEPPPQPMPAPEPPVVKTVVPAPSPVPPPVSLFASLSLPAAPPVAAEPAEAPAFLPQAETVETWEPASPAPPWHERLLVWRAATAVLLVLCVLLAGRALLTRSAGTREVAAIGPTGAPAPLFLAETAASGQLILTPLATIAVPNGRDLELWTVPADHSVPPTPLGVLPASGWTFDLPSLPPEGTQLLVTMEPRGGAKGGVFTGPVLYAGALANH